MSATMVRNTTLRNTALESTALKSTVLPDAPAASAGAGAAPTTRAPLVYFSSSSGNTARFVEKLGGDAGRIPLRTADDTLLALEPYVLVLPTYGGDEGRHAVPKQVIKFLNHAGNRALIRGVIGAGNTNFGLTYCLAADIIAAKCHVPVLYRFELMGTSEDVSRVREGLEEFWKRQSKHPR